MPRRIEGYAIVSADGMIADAAGVMPDALKFEADQRFFQSSLDRVDVVVHGRHSHERQPHSHLRQRLIVTERVAGLAADPSNDKALFWNPAGATFAQALAEVAPTARRIGIVGGTDVFGLFLDSYDVFHLTRAAGVRLPGGRPVFPGVPTQTPEQILAGHGLDLGRRRTLDVGLTLQSWRRASPARPPRASPSTP